MKEIAYLDRIIARNKKLGLKKRKELSRPLHSPLTNSERQVRARIRRKVLACVIDTLKIRASGVDSVSEIRNAIQLLCDNTLTPQERGIRDAILLNG